ncbi:hypothetical protein BpHYR1_035528, partial [Brachionus plicatilis]
CSDRCCATSYPRSISEACCKDYEYDTDISWWGWLLIGLGIVCCLPCIIVALIVICIKCCKSKKKGRVVNMGPAPGLQHGSTTIHIKTDPMPPAYMTNNLNQQNGMYQPVNPTYNSMAHPVNNTNYSSNLGQNGDQILPVLPPSTNPQMVNQSYQAYA